MMPQAYPVWEQTQHWQALLDSAGEGIWGLDLEGKCTFVNRTAADALGFDADDLLGADMHDLVHRHSSRDRRPRQPKCLIYEVFRGNKAAHQLTDTIFRRDGTSFVVAMSAQPITVDGRMRGTAVTFRDVTQSRRQDDALRKLEKQAAIGQLASSVAHEINNPLESITNLLYLIRHSNSMPDVQEYARLAQDELTRVTEITLQTLRFHRQHSKPVETDMSELLSTVMALYTGRLLVRDIGIGMKLKDTPKICCLEGEIRQVVNNLIRNALDAMSGGGRLFIRLHPQRNWRTGARGVRLTVADTGEGISAEIQPRLFEPFQTTKELTGTGLGLWVSKGIVDKHGGHIGVRTRREPGTHGTVFTVWLPVDGIINLSLAAD